MCDELEKVFLPFVESHDIQIININGDYFDRKLSLTETGTLCAFRFFSELCEVCRRKGIKLRLIEGTMSHDMLQGTVLEKAVPEGLDFRFVQTLSEEDICGLHVLYMPEEYPMDAKAFYGPFMEKEYDIIHGHGTWDFLAYKGMIDKGNRTDIHSAPVFMYEDWKKALSHGFASFGHIHSRHVMQDKVFYAGSFSSWDFKDISARGFTYYEFDTETKEHKVQFIDNAMCPRFSEFEVAKAGCGSDLQHVGQIIAAIDAEAAKCDFLRADLDGLPQDLATALRIRYAGSASVKTFVQAQDKAIVLQESDDSRFDKYKYIFDGVLPIEEVIHRYILEEKGKDIPVGTIKRTIAAENGK